MKLSRYFILIPFACAAVLVGCSSSTMDGYYDSNGNFIPYSPNRAEEKTGANVIVENPAHYEETHRVYRTVRVVRPYDRTGYYDYNGFYIPLDGGLDVPQDMFPPAGMCRIWYVNRTYNREPAVESCQGIQLRVPKSAYVVYVAPDNDVDNDDDQ